MTFDLSTIGVKVKVVEEEKLKAIITLDFGEFVVKGFRVMKSNYVNPRGDPLWLLPPSYKSAFKYHPMFYMPDKERWKELEERVWDAYYKKRDVHFKKQFDLPDDSIP